MPEGSGWGVWSTPHLPMSLRGSSWVPLALTRELAKIHIHLHAYLWLGVS